MGRATLIGFSAVAMWALLALLTDASGQVPPFLLSAITFSIGTGVGLIARLFMPAPDKSQKIPPQVWLIGIAGLFGYHFFYFTALRNAPAVEASLIAYLWPLLIVLGSALMPGEKLAWNHVVGALLGLAGTVLIVTKGGGLAFDARYSFGYAMAAVCAVLWSSYSLLSRRFPSVPTSIVTWFCAATAVLSLACHLALEQTVLPVGAGQWLAVLGLGLMPVGAAFYAWDIGVKRGNIQVLGAASYAAPLGMPPTLARSAAKTLAVAMLAVLGGLQGGPLLLVAALALSAAGDAFLSRDGEKAFLGGLASFLVAHIVYVALFLRSGGGLGVLGAEPWRGAIALAMAVFVVIMLAALWRRVGPGLRIPITVYIAAILAMGISALTTSNMWVIGGAVLFMVSDGLLATEKFLVAAISPHRAWMRLAVWALYYAAQLATTLGFLLNLGSY
ncbi:MAG: hypothetical protein E5Y74_27125 [Mesorhizobium sp.]|nr:MAG: hypothetical protein E5Y74_27125 [Mesorhizobium sp.]